MCLRWCVVGGVFGDILCMCVCYGCLGICLGDVFISVCLGVCVYVCVCFGCGMFMYVCVYVEYKLLGRCSSGIFLGPSCILESSL